MSHKITNDCTGCTACVRLCPVNAIRGERGAVHQIDARLCIDCGACGRICAAAAVLAPDGSPVARIAKRSLWPRPVWQYARCTACRICVPACPTGAVRLVQAGQSSDGAAPAQPYLAVEKACIGCSFCASACPVDVITMIAQTGRND